MLIPRKTKLKIKQDAYNFIMLYTLITLIPLLILII